MQGGGDGGQEQEGRKANRQQVRKPVNAAEQVREPLAQCQPKSMRGKRDEVPPLAAQNLDPAERPSESLLLQAVKTQRHQALAPDGRFVNADRPQAEHPKTRLRILGDDALVPAADSLQRRSADQTHRPGENDGVAVGAARHGDVEEIAIAVEQPSKIAAVLPIAIVLWRLHERHALVGEVADHLFEEGGLDQVIGIDDAEDADVLRQPPGGLIQRARLVTRPGLEVDELKPFAQLFAQCLERAPDLRVPGVVIDDLDDQVLVIELGEGGQRLAHDLDRLVVAGDLDGDLRSVRGLGAVRDAGTSAEHVEDLEQVVHA